MNAIPRFATPRTPSRKTLSGEVAQIAEMLGVPLMPWARTYVDVAMELDESGQLVFRTCLLSLPRQQGKTTLLTCILLHRALLWPERQHVIYSCQTAAASGKRITEIVRLLERSPLADQVEKVSMAMGDQSITMTNSSLLSVVASTEGSGMGGSYGLVVEDEAFEPRAEKRDQSLRPATIAVPSSQVWIASTAGTADSEFWNRYQDIGRLAVSQGSTSGLCYAEWSADRDAPLTAETLEGVMPALGHLVDIKTILADVAVMEENEARRCYLNCFTATGEAMWTKDQLDRVFVDLLADPPDPDARICFGVDYDQDRGEGGIVLADKAHRVLVMASGLDLDALRTEMVRLAERAFEGPGCTIAIDEGGPAMVLIRPLAEAGLATILRFVDKPDPQPPSREDVKAQRPPRSMVLACAEFNEMMRYGDVHIERQADIEAALNGCETKPVGAVWVFDRHKSGANISLLIAAVMALNIAEQSTAALIATAR